MKDKPKNTNCPIDFDKLFDDALENIPNEDTDNSSRIYEELSQEKQESLDEAIRALLEIFEDDEKVEHK